MFPDETYRQSVETKLTQLNTAPLLQIDNRAFYQTIKQVIKQEEIFNLKNHFEHYFSLSGFLRDLLNEIIKV